MSNLSELLPTGGGQNAVDFVASGTLSSGQTVALKADGTVSAVASNGTPQSIGSAQTYTSVGSTQNVITYDSASGKVVVAYRDSATTYGMAVVGTVSGTSISFGTPVTFESANVSEIAIAFDTANSKVIISYRDIGNSSYGTSIVGTVSGTSISFGSPVIFLSATAFYLNSDYDSASGTVVIGYQAGTSYGTAIVGTVSGTSISFGSPTVFESSTTYNISVTYDSSNEKTVIVYRNGSNYGTGIVGTVSGTSISFGSSTVFNSAITTYISSVYDSTSNNVVIAYRDSGNSNYGTTILGTVSGTSISFGAEYVFNNGVTWYISVAYNSSAKKIVVSYGDDSAVGDPGTVIEGTVSGTSISYGSPTVFESAQTTYISSIYDSGNDKIVISYTDDGNSSYGTGIVLQNEASNSASFIGITAEAISDTATGAVNVYGGINTTAKGPITTAVGARSTFNSTSYTSYPDMVYDEANQKVIVVYRPESGGSYPTAVVGTVSGTSISWGTPVIIRSNTSATGIGPKIAYDSTTEQVVIAYLISDIGYAKVGTVSGTSISFGAEATFEAGDTAYNSIAYDTANSRVVIAYKYNSAPATDDGYAVVGTVSGTSISFGSRVLFDSGTALYTSTVYDSNTGKIVVSYDSNGPKAVVGTVSGTSISFGSVATITMTTPNMTYSDLVYDAGSQKVVLTTRKNAAPNNGLALVGTVSGTTISFGTEVEFTTDAINFMAATYDSTLGKVAICYEEAATDDGKMVLGTVSGTSISFTSPVTFESTTSLNYVTAATYDPNEQVVVAGYTDNGLPVYGRATAISVTAPLTIGSDYYVQDDGSLSTTASSVKVGQAISATTINMMDLT